MRKLINLFNSKKLQIVFRRAEDDEIIEKEKIEKHFEPTNQSLDKVQKAVRHGDEDLIPIIKRFDPIDDKKNRRKN